MQGFVSIVESFTRLSEYVSIECDNCVEVVYKVDDLILSHDFVSLFYCAVRLTIPRYTMYTYHVVAVHGVGLVCLATDRIL